MRKLNLVISSMVLAFVGAFLASNIAFAGGGTTYWPIAGTDTTGGSPLAFNGTILSQIRYSDDNKMAHDMFWPNGNFDEAKYIEFDFGNQPSTFSSDYTVESAKIHLEFNTVNSALNGAKIEVIDGSGAVHEHGLIMPAVGTDLNQDIDISSYFTRKKGDNFKIRLLANAPSATQTLIDEVRFDVKIQKKDAKKEEAAPRKISNSKRNVRRGDTLIQRGSQFSKNSQVKVYFSKLSGQYYEPLTVKTSKNGSFSMSYKVNKPAGTYKWYAVDAKSGKKSKTVSYIVK